MSETARKMAENGIGIFPWNRFSRRYRLGPVHANNGLALAARRAEREECDEANTGRIRKEHDAAIGPSGGQPHK
ncbi:hypothetical protein [Burkholderia ubonensis]|uniref:hypothetical protein n=1 Tax=Burkholderia ubonensis TaxID=101571 RepID=UPI00114C9A8B|nr:hypothetical protein [Burkholderia ubonensis]MDY7792518.1 hypothetical protein [Burkholderia ubonensis]